MYTTTIVIPLITGASLDTYIIGFDAECLRDTQRNYYIPPIETPHNFQSVPEVDLDFLHQARHSRQNISNLALAEIATQFSYSAAQFVHQMEGEQIATPRAPVGFEYLPWLDLLLIHNAADIHLTIFDELMGGFPCAAIGPSRSMTRTVDLGREDLIYRTEQQFEINESFARPLDVSNDTTVNVFSHHHLMHVGDSINMILPSDALVHKQWYLFGPSQGVEHGANIIDAWAASVLIAKARKLPAVKDAAGTINFQSVLAAIPGMNVAVADSGCARNLDLINKYAHLKGCPPTAKLDKFGQCIGFDYGNDNPDPTLSTESHGTQTAGLIAAESNNVWGIAATCPTCKVLCLKIFNDDTKTLSTTAIVRAIEHIGKSGVKVSNHSYGGFGDDKLERYAFEKLTADGSHLAFIAAGNAGCNLDCRGNLRCLGKRCGTNQIWTPASYEMPGIVSVASNTRRGSVSMFSNTGAQSVKIFVPGSEIISVDRKGSPSGSVGSGTSFASPIAAGVAAFIWSVFPQASALQVKDSILDTARYNTNFQGLASVPGTIDAYAAMERLANLIGI